MNYLDSLNPEQRKAVENTEGPIMIIAGAGSGKTRVLTYRIAHLIKQGVAPHQILALTFTNKAAREMKERIKTIVSSSEASNIWMGTFHSVFARILRVEAERLGYPQAFTIYDTDDSKNLIKSIIQSMGLDDKVYKPSLVYNRISNAKNNLISSREYLNNSEIVFEDKCSGKPKIGFIYQAYEERCFKASAMDFDDLLFKTNVLLKNNPDLLYKYQQRFKYILVDEYQDTNYSQYLIVKKLAAMYQNICVVGDDAQSIYSFRGANIQNILKFEKDYPDLKVFKLEQNYRSTKTIVEAANSVIKYNQDQLKKSVWTDNPQGEKIRILEATTDNEEGQLVANKIFELRMQNQLSNGDFAILYRTNSQSRTMEEALRKRNIPYRIYGGLSFYKRKEIKDLIAYFRLCVNHNDEEGLKRVINYPVRGIGKTTLERIEVIADEQKIPLWSVLEQCGTVPYFNAGTTKKIMEFVYLIKSFKAQLNKLSAYNLAKHIAISSGLLKELEQDKTPEGISRIENIEELLNAIQEFTDTPDENPEEPVNRNLEAFLQEVALLTDADENDKDGENNKVSLMTIHAAKGLEFPCVFVVGVEENLFPSQLSIGTKEELEEERRLFYVAMTRAEKHLFISYAQNRYRYGQIHHAEPSRFIDEIDEKLIDKPIAPPARGGLSSDFNEERNQAWGGGFNRTFSKPANPTQPKPSFPKPALPKKLVKMEQATRATSSQGHNEGISNENLKEGMTVEHQRFGRGKVMNLEGNINDLKATILFEKGGTKQILLKFAKLNIIE
jgi:DNA helicase-2/ATP-dependent DNA helicase PcrA